MDVIAKAEVLVEALPYIQRFQGSIFVVKYGGGFMDDPNRNLRERVAGDIVLLAAVGIKVVVVHGGGKAISRAMEGSGLRPKFINGLRVTDAEGIKVVEKTLNREVNREICALLEERKGRPLGLFGNDIFSCRKLFEKSGNGEPVDLGYVGEIERVKPEMIESVLAGGYTPVISPIATDGSGVVYNTNADSAAAKVATALRARRLVYLCDVPGLLEEPDDPKSIISTLRREEVAELKKRGIIAKGMLPKVNSAMSAIEEGVHRVHFVEGRLPHSLLLEIFTDRGIGTEIVKSTPSMKNQPPKRDMPL